MGILNKLFGFRWSLYIVRNENELLYVVHGNSVMKILGSVMVHFANDKKPVKPWSLYLNFNKKHKKIKLKPKHFLKVARGIRGMYAGLDMEVSKILIKEIKAVDPDYGSFTGGMGDPVFMEAATKKKLEMYSDFSKESIQKRIDDIEKGKPKEITFTSVMQKVFGKA